MVTTDRLVHRIAAPGDASDLAAYFARNEARFAPWGEARSHDEESWRTWFDDRWTRRTFRAVFLASLPGESALVAMVMLSLWDAETDGSGELSYTVDGAYEGRGFASEAAAHAIRYARSEGGRTALFARYECANVRSGALLARLGFVEVARTAFVPGRPTRTIAITRRDLR